MEMMMDSPFYGRSYWNVPSHPRPRSHRPPSVREIPVHYFGSERPSRADSAVKIRNRSDWAVKIQKVFRGFLVRKSLKKITEIRSEVEEIDKRISKKETIGLIGIDSKERLKINEMLMNLLFRLDSVRGVDSGVRDFRKTVIKKAIALQEFLDAVVSSNKKNDQILEDDAVDNVEKIVEAVDQKRTVEVKVECTEDGENRDDSMPENTEAEDDNEIVENQNNVEDENLNGVEDKETIKCQIEEPVKRQDQKDREDENVNGEEDKETNKCQIKEHVKNQIDYKKYHEDVEDYNAMPAMGDCPEESVGTSQIESQADSSSNLESLIEACEEDDSSSPKQENNAIETDEAENKEVNVNVKESSGPGEEHTRNRELLERMVEDNGKMMDLMAQLFARNEMQTRMLCSLSHRVGQLERAFMCEKQRKQKKRQAAGIVDGCQASQDKKKCGKK